MQAISSLGSAQRLRRLELKQALPKQPPPTSPDYRLPASYSALQEPGASAAYISWKTHLVIRRLMIVFSRQHVGP